jgi:hypothetical protein
VGYQWCRSVVETGAAMKPYRLIATHWRKSKFWADKKSSIWVAHLSAQLFLQPVETDGQSESDEGIDVSVTTEHDSFFK